MRYCKNCGNRLEFIDRIFFSKLCFLCQKKDLEKYKLERENEKIKKEKEKKAISEIKIYIKHSYTLGEHSKEYYIEWENWTYDTFAVYPLGNTKKDPFFFDKSVLISLVIKNGYKVKNAINQLVEDKFVKVEAEKIKERQRKRKIREKAEKKLYGTIKTKRKSLTEEEKEMIFDKFDNECAVCGEKEGLHIHHKDENSSNNQMSNLVILCRVCHKKTHMKVR